jgi:hypothetical protein
MRTGLARIQQLCRSALPYTPSSPRARSYWLVSFSCSLSLLSSSCHELQPCRNVTTSEEISPNGQLKAVTFRRLCPEEHSISTHVSIVRVAEALPDGNGNVFGFDNEIAIRVSWLNDSRLAVYTYVDPAKATKIEHAGNISIEYSRIIETTLVPPIPDPVPSGVGTPGGETSVRDGGKP